ncbi:hypothetical protein GCM10010381_24430 [Streptomyces xantholiticus]|nr:hypothetical protein GCM10010381_24430 [Streptomyces xantholiticus]
MAGKRADPRRPCSLERAGTGGRENAHVCLRRSGWLHAPSRFGETVGNGQLNLGGASGETSARENGRGRATDSRAPAAPSPPALPIACPRPHVQLPPVLKLRRLPI